MMIIKKEIQIVSNKPLPKLIPVAGMIPNKAIPCEEAPIVDRMPDIPVQNTVTSPRIPSSRDYEIYAKEAPINECAAEKVFPVAPVAVLHGEDTTFEPIEKETLGESLFPGAEPASGEPAEKAALEEKTQASDKAVSKEETPKKKTPPPERPKPTYDLSKIVFPGEKKPPVKIKSKVVIKTISSSGQGEKES